MDYEHINSDMHRKVYEVSIHAKYICVFGDILIIDKKHKRKRSIIKRWLNNEKINDIIPAFVIFDRML